MRETEISFLKCNYIMTFKLLTFNLSLFFYFLALEDPRLNSPTRLFDLCLSFEHSYSPDEYDEVGATMADCFYNSEIFISEKGLRKILNTRTPLWKNQTVTDLFACLPQGYPLLQSFFCFCPSIT